MMNIRRFKKDDYQAILDVYAASKLDELCNEKAAFELLPLEKDTKRLKRLLESDIYVCEEDHIIGYAAHCGSEISALFVHPKGREKGIGKGLLEFVLSIIKGPAELYVAKSNTSAKELYQKYDFKIVEEFETDYNGVPVLANKMAQL
jgi:putative acetyltransferase